MKPFLAFAGVIALAAAPALAQGEPKPSIPPADIKKLADALSAIETARGEIAGPGGSQE